jgi:hypothetical protein
MRSGGGRHIEIKKRNTATPKHLDSYSYSPTRNWLNTVITTKGPSIIQSLTYTRDHAGRIITVAGDRAEDSWTYAYDDLDRLLSAANTNTPVLSQTFSYDLAGNLTANSSLGAYVYPAQGLASVQPHAVQSVGDWGFSYDANGNQTVRTTLGTPDRTITYDPDNRPALVAANGSSVTYLYGPDSERLKKLNGSDETLYLGASERDPAGGFTLRTLRLIAGISVIFAWSIGC